MKIQLINNGRIHYKDSLAQQTEIFEEMLKAKQDHRHITHHTLIFNEHYPVITMGMHAKPDNLLVTKEMLSAQGIELFEINRGGDATYHGPGQWTIYPIFDLEELGIGVREYVERLEEVAIQTIKPYGLHGERLDGASGVWLRVGSPRPEKIAALGIHCSRYVTMHGIAFNVNTDPDAFRFINPCGFTDRGVTSLRKELRSAEELSMIQLAHELAQSFSNIFERELVDIDTFTKGDK